MPSPDAPEPDARPPDARDAPGRTALVLGATGGIGGETAAALARHGWRIRALARDPGEASARRPDWDWVRGDAMDAARVAAAAAGAGVIVHAVNPPGYRDWDKLVLPMVDNTIAAARASGARVLLPGTIYNYGPDAYPVLREDSPQNPTTRKGRIRVALERRLEEAAESGARCLILRLGDFFGPRPGNNWFSQALVTPGKPVRRITTRAGRASATLGPTCPTRARRSRASRDARGSLSRSPGSTSPGIGTRTGRP